MEQITAVDVFAPRYKIEMEAPTPDKLPDPPPVEIHLCCEISSHTDYMVSWRENPHFHAVHQVCVLLKSCILAVFPINGQVGLLVP